MSLFYLNLIGHGASTAPPESADLDERKGFLMSFVFGFFVHFPESLFAATTRLRAELIQTRDIEWIPFVIDPIHFVITLVANGWFWLGFNPFRWQVMRQRCQLRELGTNGHLHTESGNMAIFPIESRNDVLVFIAEVFIHQKCSCPEFQPLNIAFFIVEFGPYIVLQSHRRS
jgi:hypothetical protein